MKVADDVDRVRELVKVAVKQHRVGTPYDAAFRDEVIRYTRPRLEAGARIGDIAEEIGISYWTLWGWFRPTRRERDARLRSSLDIVPVKIVSSPPRAITLTAPHGVRIEGLDLDTAAELIKRLA